MDNLNFRKLFFGSWNVRGLGDDDKCSVVRDNIAFANFSILCIQESKLISLSQAKSRLFLPPALSKFDVVDADGSRGGMVTAWDPRVVSLVSSIHRSYSLTTSFASTTSDIAFSVTNIYAPSDHSLMPDFVAEMTALAPLVSGPCLILGDFNLIRSPSEKNSPNFNQGLADTFNALINVLALFELPLLDRLFTWSNAQAQPILVRLNRVFFQPRLE
jgi:hypothetical protein